MKRIVRIGQAVIGIAGVLGTLVCMAAMVGVAIGLVGVGTSAVMAGMGSQGQPTSGQAASPLAFLLQAGPTILLVSIGAITLAIASRRWMAAIPALLVGGSIYWGMYSQPRLPVMYITMGLGLFCWTVISLWAYGRLQRRASSA